MPTLLYLCVCLCVCVLWSRRQRGILFNKSFVSISFWIPGGAGGGRNANMLSALIPQKPVPRNVECNIPGVISDMDLLDKLRVLDIGSCSEQSSLLVSFTWNSTPCVCVLYADEDVCVSCSHCVLTYFLRSIHFLFIIIIHWVPTRIRVHLKQ